MEAINSTGRLAQLLGVKLDKLRGLAERVDSEYQSFIDTKGSKPRPIDGPSVFLKDVQKRIYRRLLRDYDYSEFVRAGIPSRDLKSAVAPHAGRPIVIKVDIRNFYPSLSDTAVFGVWRKLGHGTKVASLLTRLTTYKRRLPQGAPTSMALANIYMEPADEDIVQVLSARYSDLKYTRWVDDIILSGSLDPSHVLGVVAGRLRALGLSAHRARAKRQVMPAGSRQQVLGLVVNRNVSLPRRRRRLVRAIVHIANKFGGRPEVVKGHVQYLKTHHATLADQLEDSIRLAGVIFGSDRRSGS
jgi:RNA-directed DNA polymerase